VSDIWCSWKIFRQVRGGGGQGVWFVFPNVTQGEGVGFMFSNVIQGEGEGGWQWCFITLICRYNLYYNCKNEVLLTYCCMDFESLFFFPYLIHNPAPSLENSTWKFAIPSNFTKQQSLKIYSSVFLLSDKRDLRRVK
jgi:hypothetical protein